MDEKKNYGTLLEEIRTDVLIPAAREDAKTYSEDRRIFRTVVFTFEYLQLFTAGLATTAAFIAPSRPDMMWIGYVAGILNILSLTFHNLVKLSVNRANTSTNELNALIDDLKDGTLDKFQPVKGLEEDPQGGDKAPSP
jgi:hypothetical protein